MAIKKDFLGYIVSDKENAYPDGGEKGGYYYEKVEVIDLSKLGCTGYYEGSITPTSSATNPSLPIPSGIIPKWILLRVADKKAASGKLYACVQKIAEEANGYGDYYLAYGGSASKGVGNTDYNTFNGGNSQISAPSTTVMLISANYSLDTVKYNYLVLY